MDNKQFFERFLYIDNNSSYHVNYAKGHKYCTIYRYWNGCAVDDITIPNIDLKDLDVIEKSIKYVEKSIFRNINLRMFKNIILSNMNPQPDKFNIDGICL